MSDYSIVLPSKPKVVTEEGNSGVYEIDGLYPGYGHTLGNSLRRIILSSLPGAAITSVKIDGVPHEFSTIEGVKEDVVTILLNLKRVRVKMLTDEPQQLTINAKGIKTITAKDITTPGQVEILNGDQHVAELTTKNAELSIEMTLERGVGYVPKEIMKEDRVDIGIIALDAIFTPIRRVNYEVENMRVGDRTDFNRLRISIETDGIVAPRVALEQSVEIMINQLKSIVGFKEESEAGDAVALAAELKQNDDASEEESSSAKKKIEDLDLSNRIETALTGANIKTLAGLIRKSEEDILELDGMGQKGLDEIKEALKDLGLELKQ
ncbi:MAG: DNA-directed RNA polymerase subunit alpha [Candidatus Paceibacterota bacterium]